MLQGRCDALLEIFLVDGVVGLSANVGMVGRRPWKVIPNLAPDLNMATWLCSQASVGACPPTCDKKVFQTELSVY